jgi:pyridoxine 4-dehydrogenase
MFHIFIACTGLVQEIGVSNYGPEQLKKISAFLERRGLRLGSAQIQYSLLSCGKEQQQLKTLCDDLGITVIAYSPLALGLLSGKYSRENLPAGPRGVLFKNLFDSNSGGITPLLEVMQEVGDARGKTMSQVRPYKNKKTCVLHV